MIKNRYKIISKIGNGKFGIVYKGVNINTNEIIAIKTESKNTPLKLLKNETAILKYLHEQGSRCIPLIYWYGIHENNTCLVFSYYETTLENYVLSLSPTDENTSKKYDKIMSTCINILDSIHKYFVLHRDIKPQNFMIRNGELFLIDFGLATFYIDENGQDIPNTCSQTTVIGTPKYLSINIHHGNDFSVRDDFISLGYVYLWMVLRELPWEQRFFVEQVKHNDGEDFMNLNHPYHLFQKEQKSWDKLENLCSNINNKIFQYTKYCYNLAGNRRFPCDPSLLWEKS